MGKHSEEKKGIDKKWLIIIIAVIILVAGVAQLVEQCTRNA